MKTQEEDVKQTQEGGTQGGTQGGTPGGALTGRERRALRADYRKLLTEAREPTLDLTRNDPLLSALDKADKLHVHVTKPREQAIDSELMVLLTGQGVQLARALAPGARTVSVAELLSRLRSTYAPGAAGEGDLEAKAFDWAALGNDAARLFRTTYGSGPHLLGPLQVEVKSRKATERRKKDAAAPAVRPEKVNAGDPSQAATQETDRNMQIMRKVMHRIGAPVDAFELVYNGHSFAQTVENTFTLSFLVKDGMVKLTRAPGGKGVLAELSSRPTQDEFSKGLALQTQFVSRMDWGDWEKARARMPAVPCIPNREKLAAQPAARPLDEQEEENGTQPDEEQTKAAGAGEKKRKPQKRKVVDDTNDEDE